MSKENKQLVRRFHELAWTAGDLEAARELLADDLVDHNPLSFPGRASGAAGLLDVVTMIRSALPDLTRTVETQVAEDERVVTRFTDRGTHDAGELMGIPASGKRSSSRASTSRPCATDGSRSSGTSKTCSA